jgi:hypothetical protein
MKKPAFGGLLGRPGMFAEGCLVARVGIEPTTRGFSGGPGFS